MTNSTTPPIRSSQHARIQWCSILGLVVGAVLFSLLSSSILLSADGEMALALRDANITTNMTIVPPAVSNPYGTKPDDSWRLYRAVPTNYMSVLLAIDNHDIPGLDGTQYLTTTWIVCLVLALLISIPSFILFLLSIVSSPSHAEAPAYSRDLLYGSMAGLAIGITGVFMQIFSHHQGRIFRFEWLDRPAFILWSMNTGTFLGLAYPKPPRPIDNGTEMEFQTVHADRGSNLASPRPAVLRDNDDAV
ncbi:MAG: hypothetical protein M1835_001908 [Candelina submexicana]|nr:MAG: hypothetical protein M1835_001908 [Candelina submexicana]